MSTLANRARRWHRDAGMAVLALIRADIVPHVLAPPAGSAMP